MTSEHGSQPGAVERIGEYLVHRLIGEGGMGKVYEAEERLTKRRVALKVLRSELARSEQGRELFLNEMTILAHLDHPNVVRCLSCTEADGQLVMALELLEGQTLRDLLGQRGRLSFSEATAIAFQITQALSVAHRQAPPIIHRDLKPENIMILPDGTVKVMDFGIAKVLQAMSRTTTQSVGTLQYMSPEQIDAHGVDTRSDLYSLGLVFYEMLAGHAPFESSSPRELLNLQCTAPVPPLAEEVRNGLPSGIERLLLSLLEKNADDRPARAEDVADKLDMFRPAGGFVPGGEARAEPRSRPVSTTKPIPTPGAPRSDTIALVERAMEPKRVPVALAIGLVLGLSLAAAVATYLVRTLSVATPADDVVPELAAPPVSTP